MCGIFAVFGEDANDTIALDALCRTLRHRGPDCSGCYSEHNVYIAHERLAIIDPKSGAQPIRNSGKVLSANGEIYNYQSLRAHFENDLSYRFETNSDCETIIPSFMEYEDRPENAIDRLRGMFAFVLYDVNSGTYFACRDHLGIVPLYVGWTIRGSMCFASEAKALVGLCTNVILFGPGNLYSSTHGWTEWYAPIWRTKAFSPLAGSEGDPLAAGGPDPALLNNLRSLLTESVHLRTMSDVRWGVLLSGGLDSSIVAAIASEYCKAKGIVLSTFSVGLEGSQDLRAARQVATYLDTDHHELVYTVEEGIRALPDVIRSIETFDTTTIRASVPMYLLSRYIKSQGVKMVLSGEGADEVFAGYLYFHNAPSDKALQEELVRKVSRLHMFDCLRANKAMAAWGVEARVPFLDVRLVDYAMNIHPAHKNPKRNHRTEKYILRKAFERALPHHLVWRRKEQFSDGVGHGWIDGLKEYASDTISDTQYSKRMTIFPDLTPTSKEEFLYRSLFVDQGYTGITSTVPFDASIACSTPEILATWTPKGEGDGDHAMFSSIDPSGRSVQLDAESDSMAEEVECAL